MAHVLIFGIIHLVFHGDIFAGMICLLTNPLGYRYMVHLLPYLHIDMCWIVYYFEGWMCSYTYLLWIPVWWQEEIKFLQRYRTKEIGSFVFRAVPCHLHVDIQWRARQHCSSIQQYDRTISRDVEARATRVQSQGKPSFYILKLS